MGFEDFFDVDLLRSHKGFHMMQMKEFLSKEGVTGGLHGKLPPNNSTAAWGQDLWKYLSGQIKFTCRNIFFYILMNIIYTIYN